jgi:hypothetical protein
VFPRRIVWRQTTDPEAGWELVEGLASRNPEMRLLAQTFLIESGKDSISLLESALLTGAVSPETASKCIADILRNEQFREASTGVFKKPPVDVSLC